MKRLALLLLLAIFGAAALWWLLMRPQSSDITDLARSSSLPLGDVSSQIIAQTDLPPEGTRSLFDHLLAQSDGLTFPFENLVASLQDAAPTDDAPLAVMIPIGRSLLKASADFDKPRVVFATDYHASNTPASLGIAPRGQLFLGFTEGANEIEVISYNELAGRFEFQLVQNYCETCVPRIVYARRDICLTCHQGGSPIFSVRPWQETNAQPEISQRIVQARGDAPYLAVDPVQPLSSPQRIDELTDVGNFINVLQRIWLDGCGENGTACRRHMLALALQFLDDPASFDAGSQASHSLFELQALHWPAQGIPVPDNDLANRSPLDETKPLLVRLRSLFTDQNDAPAAARDNEDLETFNQLPPLPSDLDPLTRRPPKRVLTPNDPDGVYALAQMFTDADRDTLLAASGNNWSRTIESARSIPEDFFAARPFSRVRTMQALLEATQNGRANALQYCCLTTEEMSPPVAASVPPLEIAEGSELEAFERYCFACHRGNPAARLNFMGGRDEAEVKSRIMETDKIREVLDWERYRDTDKLSTLMPPVDSEQRRTMEAALAQNPKLLEEMRDMVPALFDF